MADEDLGLTGKDVTWEMLLDGVPQSVVGSISNFTTRARYDTVERKHIGTVDVDIDKIPIGWEGEFEITAKTGVLERANNTYNNARRNRIPINVVLHEVKRYRNGEVERFTYRNVQWEFETTGTRAEAVTHRIQWMSGFDRI